MNKIIALLAISAFASIATAESITLSPGETITNGISKITCSGPVAPTAGPNCGLLGSGSYNGNNWQYRVTIDGKVINATDSFQQAIDTIAKYRNANLCGTATSGTCTLLGAGPYNGNTWQYRVEINSDIFSATDSQDQALSTIASLRKASICR